MHVRMVLVGMLALTMSATAAEAQGIASEWFSGNVSVLSDYTFRGVSQTLEEPAVQGGMDLAHPSGLYIGTWGSSVNFGEDLAGGARAQVELDVYGGYGLSLAEIVDLDLGVFYYAYPGAEGDRNYNFMEIGLGASRGFGMLSTGLSLVYSPDFFAASGQGLYYGASVDVPVSMLTISGSVGQQTVEDNALFGLPDYLEYAVGASVDLMGFSLGGSFHATDIDDAECFGGMEICGSRVVVSIGRAM